MCRAIDTQFRYLDGIPTGRTWNIRKSHANIVPYFLLDLTSLAEHCLDCPWLPAASRQPLLSVSSLVAIDLMPVRCKQAKIVAAPLCTHGLPTIRPVDLPTAVRVYGQACVHGRVPLECIAHGVDGHPLASQSRDSQCPPSQRCALSSYEGPRLVHTPLEMHGAHTRPSAVGCSQPHALLPRMLDDLFAGSGSVQRFAWGVKFCMRQAILLENAQARLGIACALVHPARRGCPATREGMC
jgi:hypothetical protein